MSRSGRLITKLHRIFLLHSLDFTTCAAGTDQAVVAVQEQDRRQVTCMWT